jgi:hypothetical protein
MNQDSEDSSSNKSQPLLDDFDGDNRSQESIVDPPKELRLNISDDENSYTSSLIESSQIISNKVLDEKGASVSSLNIRKSKKQTTRAQLILRKVKNGILNSPTFKMTVFVIIAISLYADHISTILSIIEFFGEGHDGYGTMTLLLYIFNVFLRILYRIKKKRKENKPITLRRIMYPICLLDLVVPYYNDIVLEHKYKGDIAENYEALYDILVCSISSDCIPNCVITLYSQVYSDTISLIIMISTITSLFSLARNMSLIIINPFLDLEAQTNNKRRGYNTQGIGEDLLELIDTYIELLSRICIIVPFCIVNSPYGAFLYIATIALFYLGYVIGANPKQKGWDIILTFSSGLFLVAIHAKQNRFYHPKTNYKPALEEDDDDIVFNMQLLSSLSISD